MWICAFDSSKRLFVKIVLRRSRQNYGRTFAAFDSVRRFYIVLADKKLCFGRHEKENLAWQHLHLWLEKLQNNQEKTFLRIGRLFISIRDDNTATTTGSAVFFIYAFFAWSTCFAFWPFKSIVIVPFLFPLFTTARTHGAATTEKNGTGKERTNIMCKRPLLNVQVWRGVFQVRASRSRKIYTHLPKYNSWRITDTAELDKIDS